LVAARNSKGRRAAQAKIGRPNLGKQRVRRRPANAAIRWCFGLTSKNCCSFTFGIALIISTCYVAEQLHKRRAF
jgi:hypothetical protein